MDWDNVINWQAVDELTPDEVSTLLAMFEKGDK